MFGSLVGVASTNFAYFYWYTFVRTMYLSYQTVATPPGTAIELSLGAVAGALAQLFTIPVAVVTTRQQTMSKHERKGMIATGMDVVNSEDGWTGLWRGLKASLVLVVNPSITYGAYQRLRESLYPGKVALKPHEAFRMYFRSPPYHSYTDLASSRLSVEDPCYRCHTAFDCRQGWSSVEATASQKRCSLQDLH